MEARTIVFLLSGIRNKDGLRVMQSWKRRPQWYKIQVATASTVTSNTAASCTVTSDVAAAPDVIIVEEDESPPTSSSSASAAPNTVITMMCASNDSDASREVVDEELITQPTVSVPTPCPSASVVPEHLSVDHFGTIPTNEQFLENSGWLSQHPTVDSCTAPSTSLYDQILEADPINDSDNDMNYTASCLDLQEIDDIITSDGPRGSRPGSPYDPNDPVLPL